MATKLILKRFGDFRGLDLGRNHLVRDPSSAVVAQNVEVLPTGDLGPRRGFKFDGSKRESSGVSSKEWQSPMWGLEGYKYTDTTTGELKEELIGAGNNLYKLATGSITMSYSGAGTATFSFLPQPGYYLADLKINGTSQSGFPTIVDYGFSIPFYTLATLRNAINSIANFQCFLTPAAVVNGNQAARGPAAAITVRNAYSSTYQPHTFTVSTSVPTRAEIIDRTVGVYRFVDIIAQTATTLTPKLADPTETFSVTSGDEIGVGLCPAACLPYIESTTVPVGGTAFSFSYWERIFGPYLSESVLAPSTWEFYPNSHNYVMKNHSNVFYVGVPFSVGSDIEYAYTTGGGATGVKWQKAPRSTGLMKYDGQLFYQAGIPRCPSLQPIIGVGAGLGTGVYKYLSRYIMRDKQGNIIYGTASDDDDALSVINTVTTGGGSNQVALTINTPGYDLFTATTVQPYLNRGAAFVNGNQVGVNTITVTAASNTLRVGDNVTIVNRVGALDTFVRRMITAVSNTTVTINGAAIDVNNGDSITCMSCEIYRTKVGGSSFYYLGEFPVSSSYTDIFPDSSLGFKYDGPFTGNRRKDLPPVVGIIENHQGLLVGAGDPLNPETLYWSNFDSPENWPEGTGQVDIGGDDGGAITCLISDTTDMLAIFKDESYLNAVGDLDSGGYSILAYSEGGVGCPSPHGACHFRERIMFVSNKGPRILQNGVITDYDSRLLPYFFNNFYTQTIGAAISSANEAKLILRRAVLANNKGEEKLWLYIPAESGTPGTSRTVYPSASHKFFIYDYRRDDWFTRVVNGSSDIEFNAAGGIAYLKSKVYFISRVLGLTYVSGSLFSTSHTQTKYDYLDNTIGIRSTYRPQWIFLEEPSVAKEFLRIKTYRFTPSPDPTVATDFILRVRTYRNFSTASVDTDLSQTWTIATDTEKPIKLKSNNARALLLDFTVGDLNSEIYAWKLSGYEVLIAAAIRSEDIVKL